MSGLPSASNEPFPSKVMFSASWTTSLVSEKAATGGWFDEEGPVQPALTSAASAARAARPRRREGASSGSPSRATRRPGLIVSEPMGGARRQAGERRVVEVPDAEAVYDAIAEAWVRTRSAPWPAVTGFEAGLPRGARLVDLGAGSGRYLAVDEAAGLRAVGLDVSRGQLAVARRMLGPGAALLRGDARTLPVKDASADAALCIAVVHHFFEASDRLRAVSEARRILKHGGRALFSAWGSDAEIFAAARRLRGG